MKAKNEKKRKDSGQLVEIPYFVKFVFAHGQKGRNGKNNGPHNGVEDNLEQQRFVLMRHSRAFQNE
jgi:hypothetical protein